MSEKTPLPHDTSRIQYDMDVADMRKITGRISPEEHRKILIDLANKSIDNLEVLLNNVFDKSKPKD